MLTGPDLGNAIKSALEKKSAVEDRRVTQKELADFFKVKPPSIQDWINRGTIDKSKLPALWEFFRDAVGPEHWGLSQYPTGLPEGKGGEWPFSGIEPKQFSRLTYEQRLEIQGAVRLMLATFDQAKRRTVRHLHPVTSGM